MEAGKLRLLATYGQERMPRFPQAPTLREAGYDMTCPSPLEIVGPKGLPKGVINKVHDACKKAMDDPEFQAVLKKFDMMPAYLNPEDSEKDFRQIFERVGKIVQKLGLQKNP